MHSRVHKNVELFVYKKININRTRWPNSLGEVTEWVKVEGIINIRNYFANMGIKYEIVFFHIQYGYF